MAKLDEAERKRRRKNVTDIIRDEIYGAGVKTEFLVLSGLGVTYEGSKLVIPTSEVRKIAKRIMKRAAIGPL